MTRSPPSLTFLCTMAGIYVAISAWIGICARRPGLRSKMRWGRSGNGPPMTSFGAWSAAFYVLSFGSVFATGVSSWHWLHVCSWVIFGISFIETAYAVRHDRLAHEAVKHAA